jgi:hypothetical protein
MSDRKRIGKCDQRVDSTHSCERASQRRRITDLFRVQLYADTRSHLLELAPLNGLPRVTGVPESRNAREPGPAALVARDDDDVGTQADQLSRESGVALHPSPGVPAVDDEVLALDVAMVAERPVKRIPDRLKIGRSGVLRRRCAKIGEPGNLRRRLCPGGERRGQEAEGQRENQYGSWLDGEPSSSFRSAASSSARIS